jgi:hypothetical protein
MRSYHIFTHKSPFAHRSRTRRHRLWHLYQLALLCTRSAPSPARRRRSQGRADIGREGKSEDYFPESAVLGSDPVVRVVTCDGIGSDGAIESSMPCLRPVVLPYEPSALGRDPADALRHVAGVARRAPMCQGFPLLTLTHTTSRRAAGGPFNCARSLPTRRLCQGDERGAC